MKAIALKSFGMLALVLMSFSLMSLTDEDGGVRKFWGTGYSWGSCGPNTDGTPGCFQGQYSTYYVFWIATGPEEPVPGVTRPCTCP